MDRNHVSTALLLATMAASGEWQLYPQWMQANAHLLLKAQEGADMNAVWPKHEPKLMAMQDGVFAAAGTGKMEKGKALGVLSIVGPIYKYGWNSSKTTLAYLRDFATNPMVGGVKIILDSPGGQVAGTREVYEAIANFPKPIITVVDGTMASAAYYQFAGSNRIVASQPNDQIGSIGTYTQVTDMVAYYKSFGLDVYEVYAKASTQKNEDVRELLESKGKTADKMLAMLQGYNDQMIADVKAARGTLLGKGQDPFEGRVFFAADAIENGLIDELLPEADTLGVLAEMVSINAKTTIQMGLKEKLMAFLATEGEGNTDEPTVESLTASLGEVTAARDGALAQVTAITAERDGALAQVTSLTAERDGATAQVAALTAEVARLGKQPGAMGSNPAKGKDDVQGELTAEQEMEAIMAALPHNRVADSIVAPK